jgi:hypothetical protein
MKRLLSATLAGKILIGFFILLLVMHLLVLLGVIPSSILWGGQVNDDGSNLLALEIIAIALTLVFAGLSALKIMSLKSVGSKLWINIGVWIVFAYLVLNTVGNFASGISAETLIFGPITILMAFFALRLAIEREQ